jgi:hypothetical protein
VTLSGVYVAFTTLVTFGATFNLASRQSLAKSSLPDANPLLLRGETLALWQSLEHFLNQSGRRDNQDDIDIT